MIQFPTWRELFYQLAEQYPDCLMLKFTIKLVSDAGFQSEITSASTAQHQPEVFSSLVKNALLQIVAGRVTDAQEHLQEFKVIPNLAPLFRIYFLSFVPLLSATQSTTAGLVCMWHYWTHNIPALCRITHSFALVCYHFVTYLCWFIHTSFFTHSLPLAFPFTYAFTHSFCAKRTGKT